MEIKLCVYCKNKIKIKGFKPNKKFCSLKCRYEYRKSSGYYSDYYHRRLEGKRVIRHCLICENILPKGKSKYCTKQCLYLKLQLKRRAKKITSRTKKNKIKFNYLELTILLLFFINIIIFLKSPVSRYHHVMFILFALTLTILSNKLFVKKIFFFKLIIILLVFFNFTKNFQRI